MRIGIVTHYMPPHSGGIERVAETLFQGYEARGHEVRWLASRTHATQGEHAGERVTVACWNGLEARLGVPMPVWAPGAVGAVSRLADWADVVHGHDCLYPGSVLLALSRLAPLVLTQHVGPVQYRSALLNALQGLAYRTLGRWVLRRAARVVYATPAAAAFVPALLAGDSLSARTIPNGIPLQRFHPASEGGRAAARASLGVPPDRPVVLFAGRLVEKKGVSLVLETARLVPEAHFLIVGDGPLAGSIPDAPNFTWRPHVAPQMMAECYHAADCLLLPSLGEGLPLVVQEALACGLPAVVRAGEAFAADLVSAGVARAAAPRAEVLAHAVRTALAGPTDRDAIRAFAEQHWGLDTMIDTYLSCLAEVVSAAGRVAGGLSPGEVRR